MALGIAFAFRLSRAAILLGAYVNNPWTLAPMYMAGTLAGLLAARRARPRACTAIDWDLARRASSTSELAIAPAAVTCGRSWSATRVLGVARRRRRLRGAAAVLERRQRMPTAPSASLP